MPNKECPVNDAPALSRFAALVALTFSCVMLIGAWQVIAVLYSGGLEFPRTWIDFREGRSTGAIEKQVDHKLPARTALIAAANTVRYLLTGSAGEQVRTGRDGWLFLADELRFEVEGNTHLQVRATLLGNTARLLEQQGVKLIVALIPDKARVCSSKLAGGHYPEYNNSRYQDALNAFQKQGVTVVDLLQPLALAAAQGDVYYRTDTHWNQNGAQVAAETIAKKIRQTGLELEKTTFSSTFGEPVERSGDLIRLMGLEGAPKTLGPRPDLEAPVATRQTSTDNAAGLFDDNLVPIVLTGTSYSLRGNFHGFLQQALSTKVLNAAKDGGGFLQATTQYLKDEAFRSAKPKVLVWEVPERFLTSKLDEEQRWLGKVGLQ